MVKHIDQIKAEFVYGFYLATKDAQVIFKSKEPILTWLNDYKKPMVSLDFLIFVDHPVRVMICVLLQQYSADMAILEKDLDYLRNLKSFDDFV